MSRQTDRWYWVWVPIYVSILYIEQNIPDTAGNLPQIEESIPFHRKAFLTSQESFPDFTRNDSFCKEWQSDQKEWQFDQKEWQIVIPWVKKEWFLCQKGMIPVSKRNDSCVKQEWFFLQKGIIPFGKIMIPCKLVPPAKKLHNFFIFFI